MSASRSILHWFSGVSISRPNPRSPTGCTVVKDDGTSYDVTFTNWADRTRVANDFGHVIGSVTWLPAVGEWTGSFESPFDREHTLYLPKGAYASREEAVDALLTAREAFRAKEQALRDDPAAWLDRELLAHDWTAAYSDAPGVCDAADRHWDFIQTLRTLVPPEVYDDLIRRHNPWLNGSIK